MLILQNETLLGFLKHRYTVQDIDALTASLTAHGTFAFPTTERGLFPAAVTNPATAYTAYDRVWVRDNVHLAHVFDVLDRGEVAARNAATLAEVFRRQRPRFVAVSRGDADPADAQQRPAIRFHAASLEPEPWAHAQNDALGYFLWLYCRLARARPAQLGEIAWDVLALFPPYLERIAYFRDEDSGHWEEGAKISASSIGAVVAGLRELRALCASEHAPPAAHADALSPALVDRLIAAGHEALATILPFECVQDDPRKHRRADGALLFLIYPLAVVDDTMADRIVDEVRGDLQGEVGIRRYLGDSFWCTDYRKKVPPERRTTDWSADTRARDALAAPGEEAEWCLFDPILSIIFGERYRRTGAPDWLARQTQHLNRALAQLTGPGGDFPELRCPELYHRENGRLRPSDATPLLWTQAMLLLALRGMRESAARAPLSGGEPTGA
jgi:phosphorylase kinase alpha/beta subunit